MKLHRQLQLPKAKGREDASLQLRKRPGTKQKSRLRKPLKMCRLPTTDSRP